MVIIGLTGQTGAGKTTVSELFAAAGYHVINADKVARTVMEPHTACYSQIVHAFGHAVLQADKRLNRQALADIVFSDPRQLDRLNRITYPHIIQRISEKVEQCSANGDPFVLLDAPTLFESGADLLCNRIVSVLSNRSLRSQRIMRRDQLSEEQARRRIDAQPEDDFYRKRSDFVLYNDGSLDEFIQKAGQMIEQIGANSNRG